MSLSVGDKVRPFLTNREGEIGEIVEFDEKQGFDIWVRFEDPNETLGFNDHELEPVRED